MDEYRDILQDRRLSCKMLLRLNSINQFVSLFNII